MNVFFKGLCLYMSMIFGHQLHITMVTGSQLRDVCCLVFPPVTYIARFQCFS